ncbi:MAG: alpha/beta hydrolase [Pseudomonadota bacterium]
MKFWVVTAFLVLGAACAPLTQKTGPHSAQPAIEAGYFVTTDGARLPLKVHVADAPRAVIVALHGFNDYCTEFDMAAQWWMQHGITTYAYDQRGFGGAPQRGIWPGAGILADDARSMISLVRKAHPGQPVYLLGMSMGGAVALELAGSSIPPDVDGVILAAPAVWGWSSLNPVYRGVLWLAAHTVRANRMTGQGLGVRASDNIEMLRALGRDPMIIHETRTDAVYGLVGQMERGYRAAERVRLPVLLLYGEKDEVIPREPVQDVIAALPEPKRVITYPNGYHMLLRDLQAENVWRDIAAFIHGSPPSSG